MQERGYGRKCPVIFYWKAKGKRDEAVTAVAGVAVAVASEDHRAMNVFEWQMEANLSSDS